MSNRTKEIAAIMAEYEPGQVWQVKSKRSELWWDIVGMEPDWCWSLNDYRRKPEPKTRPMRPDEWPPVGSAVRLKSGGRISTLSSKATHGIYLPMIGEIGMSAIQNHEFSTDGEKTWLPFTVTEQA